MCWSTHYYASISQMRERVYVKQHKIMLEDIPEETELGIDTDNTNAQCHEEDEFDATPEEIEEALIHLETDLEVLRRAMDMGIWALCLGFGYMLSKASIPHLRSPPRLFGF